MLLQLIAIALLFFVVFGAILFAVEKRKKRRKKTCADSDRHRCPSCSCDHFQK